MTNLKPSRTYMLGLVGIASQVLFAGMGMIVALCAPETLADLVPLLSSTAMGAAAAAGVSAGGLSWRDVASKGLTSSQGEMVIEANRQTPAEG